MHRQIIREKRSRKATIKVMKWVVVKDISMKDEERSIEKKKNRCTAGSTGFFLGGFPGGDGGELGGLPFSQTLACKFCVE